MSIAKIQRPEWGEAIRMGDDGHLNVPDQPIVTFIEGDGIGPDIWAASKRVLDAAVEQAYAGKRKISWMEVFAGEKAWNLYGQTDDAWLPEETLDAIRTYLIGLKGPLTTPIGGGMSSLNVALRQQLDLYVCLRPVKYFQGVPSPVKKPEEVDMVIFRENTEDIYAGIEWADGTAEVEKFRRFLIEEMGVSNIRFPDSCGLGVKPVSREGTERLVRAAIEYALAHDLPSVTLVHKGNIMKYTEGAFRNWGYELAQREFGAEEIDGGPWCRLPNGLIIKDCIADIALQQVLTRASDFSVIATLNLNGDYLSDALAAQVGGIGIAPGANINYHSGHAIFEATHGTAPKYAGKNMVNPSSVLLSGEMMLRYMGWDEAADLIIQAIPDTIAKKTVTYDFHRLMDGAVKLSTSEFADALIHSMSGAASVDEASHFDLLSERFHELFSAAAETTQDSAKEALEKAREQLTQAGTFSEEQGKRLQGFIENDLRQMAEHVKDQAEQKLSPSRLGSGAMSVLASVFDAAGDAFSSLSKRVDEARRIEAGEITSAGSLQCVACAHTVQLEKTSVVLPCSQCQGTSFKKSY